ncbi:ribosomal L7Ae/L30e/S12e/Gadd45 family protein [Haloimpatiens sp. FM7330]|uniref:ribosomal L7Ae/L30e/S12e/Gadd45 family protein n=1 Tax=Haloimpatiens sp. FM7330 TaxID=3298610 RepID=UPI003641665E
MGYRLEGRKVVGIKQTIKAVKNDIVEEVYVAKDVEQKVIEPLIQLAKQKSLELVYIDTMNELGKLCGIDVGASVAAELKKQ